MAIRIVSPFAFGTIRVFEGLLVLLRLLVGLLRLVPGLPLLLLFLLRLLRLLLLLLLFFLLRLRLLLLLRGLFSLLLRRGIALRPLSFVHCFGAVSRGLRLLSGSVSFLLLCIVAGRVGCLLLLRLLGLRLLLGPRLLRLPLPLLCFGGILLVPVIVFLLVVVLIIAGDILCIEGARRLGGAFLTGEHAILVPVVTAALLLLVRRLQHAGVDFDEAVHALLHLLKRGIIQLLIVPFLFLLQRLPDVLTGLHSLRLLQQLVQIRLQFGAGVGTLHEHFVVFGKRLGLVQHRLNLIGGQFVCARDCQRGHFVVSRAFLHCIHLKHAIAVQVKRHLNANITCWGLPNALQVELPKEMAVLCAGPLPLIHIHLHVRLVVINGPERLVNFVRNGVVARDQHLHLPPVGSQPNAEGRHIQQQHVPHLFLALLAARQDVALDRSPIGHSLVGVDGVVQSLALEEVRHHFLNLRNTGAAAHHHHLVHVRRLHFSIRQHLLDLLDAGLKQFHVQLLELGTRDLHQQILAVLDGIHFDFRRAAAGQRPLGLLARSPELAQPFVVLGDVEP
mmetsp:Transcript_22413/g.38175  ORF Transcript_22413/g.38175 Transcript_22413/m.38175 type:complete len:560 (-) Transcript_22413:787-2466(-)